jgi:hypothetical protein
MHEGGSSRFYMRFPSPMECTFSNPNITLQPDHHPIENVPVKGQELRESLRCVRRSPPSTVAMVDAYG